jgi:hypothetical protein
MWWQAFILGLLHTLQAMQWRKAQVPFGLVVLIFRCQRVRRKNYMFEERLNEKIPWCVSLNEKVSLEECKFMVFI